jgi:hypothetical protein
MRQVACHVDEHATSDDAVAGSFFDPLPPGAGGYLVCAVLRDWDDGSARAILRRCAQAAGTDGRVFVVEKFVTDTDHRTEMDLRVLAYFGGRERGIVELTSLAAPAGLRVATVHSAGGNTGRRTDRFVTAPGAPTAVVSAPGTSGRDPLQVHASPSGSSPTVVSLDNPEPSQQGRPAGSHISPAGRGYGSARRPLEADQCPSAASPPA